MRAAALIASTVLAVAALWMLRFDIEVLHTDSETAFMLDRWTGNAYVLSGLIRYPVVPESKDEAGL